MLYGDDELNKFLAYIMALLALVTTYMKLSSIVGLSTTGTVVISIFCSISAILFWIDEDKNTVARRR